MIGETMGVVAYCRIDIVNSMCLILAHDALISALVSIFVVPAALCICEPVFNKISLNWRGQGPSGKGKLGARLQHVG